MYVYQVTTILTKKVSPHGPAMVLSRFPWRLSAFTPFTVVPLAGSDFTSFPKNARSSRKLLTTWIFKQYHLAEL